MKPSELSATVARGLTPSEKMAIALTLTRTENNRVKAGTAAPSPIFGGVDPEEVRRRRSKGKSARQARAAHARGRK